MAQVVARKNTKKPQLPTAPLVDPLLDRPKMKAQIQNDGRAIVPSFQSATKQEVESDEEASELSFEMIVKTKPSPNRVREFLQACADKMNDDTDEDSDFE
jgi:hypothetical protein